MPYTNTPSIEEVQFSCAVAQHKGIWDYAYGSHRAVCIQLDQLRRRFPGARLIKRYDNIPFSKVDNLKEAIEARNRGEQIDLDKIAGTK